VGATAAAEVVVTADGTGAGDGTTGAAASGAGGDGAGATGATGVFGIAEVANVVAGGGEGATYAELGAEATETAVEGGCFSGSKNCAATWETDELAAGGAAGWVAGVGAASPPVTQIVVVTPTVVVVDVYSVTMTIGASARPFTWCFWCW
jgi:hypothetical protein